MKADEAPAVIEIIDDGTNPFDDRAHNHTVQDAGGPRWVGPVAAAALLAIVVYGVATSASSDAPKVALPSTTTIVRPATTVPTATVPTATTLPPPQLGYYAATPPDDFTVAFADAGDVGRGFFPGIYELWATDGASASQGSWFSVQTQPGRPFSVDAYRVQADDLSVAISHTPGGPTVASFSATEAGAVTITALGISDDDLVRLAQSLRVGRATMSITDADRTAGYQKVSSLPPERVIIGIPAVSVSYQSSTDLTRQFDLQIAPRNSPNLGGSDVARETAVRFTLQKPITFEVHGQQAIAGAIAGSPSSSLATWIDGDHMVTLSGSLTPQELIDIAGTVREVSANTWFDMQSHTTGQGSTFDTVGSVQVSDGTDTSGEPWVVSAAVTKFPNQDYITWQWQGSGFSSATEAAAKIYSVVDGRRTYVLAELPRAVAATAQLEIDRLGLDPVVVGFNDVVADLDRTLAAYAFSEPAQYTARIVTPDGTVIATWPR